MRNYRYMDVCFPIVEYPRSSIQHPALHVVHSGVHGLVAWPFTNSPHMPSPVQHSSSHELGSTTWHRVSSAIRLLHSATSVDVDSFETYLKLQQVLQIGVQSYRGYCLSASVASPSRQRVRHRAAGVHLLSHFRVRLSTMPSAGPLV